MKHVGMDAEMRGVVDILELGLVGSVVDELIITLFLGCLRDGFVDIGVAQLGECVICISHPEYSPSVTCSRQVCLSWTAVLTGSLRFPREGSHVVLRHGPSPGIASVVSRTCSCRVRCVRCPSSYHKYDL